MRVALVAVMGCASLPPTTDVATDNPHPLREAAGALMLGTAIDAKAFNTDERYQQIAAYQFDAVVSETKMKMAAIEPTRTTPPTYDFTAGDALVAFAEAHAMTVRGHTLVYPNGSPGWLLAITDANELETVMTTYVADVVAHWAGRVAEWDVVNEPYDYDPEMPTVPAALDNKIFTKLLHAQYIEDALRAARHADPSAKLFINENGIETASGAPKLAALADEVKYLRESAAEAPLVDGVGMEFHVPLYAVTDIDATLGEVRCAMDTLAQLGVEIHVSELDIRSHVPADAATRDKQAQLYAGTLDACRSNPRCTGWLVWGFTDRFSWIPGQYPGDGDADLLDDTYAFKPAYDAVQAALAAPPSGIGCVR